MPLYDYECSECGHKAEEFTRYEDPRKILCPACGKESYVRQVVRKMQFDPKDPDFHCNAYSTRRP